MNSVYEIKRGHGGARSSLFYAYFKCLEIYLPQRPFGETRVVIISVRFLIVCGKVFYCCRTSVVLFYSSHRRCGTETREQRILGIIFEISAAQRIPLNIHSGRKPERYAEQLHLRSDNITCTLYKLGIPALSES